MVPNVDPGINVLSKVLPSLKSICEDVLNNRVSKEKHVINKGNVMQLVQLVCYLIRWSVVLRCRWCDDMHFLVHMFPIL